MAKNKYYFQSGDAVCPYYIRQTSREICCEGMRKGITAHQHFVRDSSMKLYMQDHCCSIPGCKKCLYHQMLEEKYGACREKGKL